MQSAGKYSVFDGDKLFCRGSLESVVRKIKRKIGSEANSSMLVICDSTGNSLDFNFNGSLEDVEKRLAVFTTERPIASSGRGRPKLGVVCREVSLLPRHWEWLATQSGGSSAELRRLVDAASKRSLQDTSIKKAQARVHSAMTILAGDFAGYEEALRAVYRKEQEAFMDNIKQWPSDIQRYCKEQAQDLF